MILKKISILAILFTALILGSSTLCPAQKNSFNPSGYFIPQESLTNSSNVRWIQLSDFCGGSKKCPLTVELRIGSEKKWLTFSQSFLKIEDYDVIFETKPVNGVSYEFEGRLVPDREEKISGEFAESADSRTVLTGVLRTRKSGKTVRAETLKFYYTIGY
ncbi:MAG: hypothetical protein JSS81_05145 [Acidobacteria bacterium]|nr:hypothetical protein [Acidobacteriota bacterium]